MKLGRRELNKEAADRIAASLKRRTSSLEEREFKKHALLTGKRVKRK